MFTLTDAAVAFFYVSCAMFGVALIAMAAIIYEFSKKNGNDYDA